MPNNKKNKAQKERLTSQDLLTIFQQSSIVEQYFFSRKVPSAPVQEDPLVIIKGDQAMGTKMPDFKNT